MSPLPLCSLAVRFWEKHQEPVACVWEGVVGARKGTLCLTVSLSTAGFTPTANLFEIAFVADVIVS